MAEFSLGLVCLIALLLEREKQKMLFSVCNSYDSLYSIIPPLKQSFSSIHIVYQRLILSQLKYNFRNASTQFKLLREAFTFSKCSIYYSMPWMKINKLETTDITTLHSSFIYAYLKTCILQKSFMSLFNPWNRRPESHMRHLVRPLINPLWTKFFFSSFFGINLR